MSAAESAGMQNKQIVSECVFLNCSVVIDLNGIAQGNVTEKGMVNHLVKIGQDAKTMISQKTEDNILTSIPFNSKRKRATIAYKHHELQDTVRVFCKGAPEIVLNYCSTYLDASGNQAELSEEKA